MEEIETQTYPKANLGRILYTILYLIIGRFISMILFVIAVTQFIYTWVIGEPNAKILNFTEAMAEYGKQLVLYVGFNSDERPWPVGNWPSVEED